MYVGVSDIIDPAKLPNQVTQGRNMEYIQIKALCYQ